MAPRCFLPLFLIFFCFVTVQSVIYKLKGQQIQWVPIATEAPNEILWNHNGNKVVEFDGTVAKVYGSYEGRVTLDRQTAQLQINDLRLEDSGKYDSEIYLKEKWLQTSFELKVIEKVAKPTITCQMRPDSSSKTSAVLLCIEDLSQAPSPLQFEWISGGKVQPGPQLTISLGGELDTQQYICQISNPLSQENGTFTAKDCYTDAGLSGGLIAAIIVIIILVISACVVILLLALKHKGSKKKEVHQVELESLQRPAAALSRADVLLNSPYYSVYKESQPKSPSQTGSDEEHRPFLEDRQTGASPPPQNQLDTDNRNEPETAPVTKKTALVSVFTSIPNKMRGLKRKKKKKESSSLHDETSSGQVEDHLAAERSDGEKRREAADPNVAKNLTKIESAGWKDKTQSEGGSRPLEDQLTAASPQPQNQPDTESGPVLKPRTQHGNALMGLAAKGSEQQSTQTA